ncbi:preprotein translocase subunit SecG [Jannaschia aquimarina]|uniref:Protein-export membrane protein SecG n=1 Tax=Jannaschia aquimarina TaxID=935700 RepID=A0A0D1DCH3_9RHOB|nr:preprotein translocase subunit SecG [Jannaschia aquimarina]KIT17683.1 preprotein translocase subunit SecG [Jannaschia aquimarina]SNS79123.1 preprotein translocase subunit SecG [Jannaschia aquimarina]
MENVLLVIHLILALCLIGIVLLQRSEGGGLGIGGGGGAATGRPATTGMAKLTWVFAIAFLTTSITLTILAAQNAGGGSVADTVPETEEVVPGSSLPAGSELLPPSPTDAPLTPPRSE